jgi:hypothetical protein
MQALEVRMQDRSKSLRRDLGDRAAKETADITAILTELRQSILNEKGEVDKKETGVKEIQTDVESNLLKIQATQEQINAFNNALFKFAIGCKNNDGFAIIQGHKWLQFPQSIF